VISITVDRFGVELPLIHTSEIKKMKLNPQHAIENKKEFAALKWCLEKAKLNIEEDGYKGYIFEGRLPYYQIQHLHDLIKLGYKHPASNSIVNINWVTGSNYHGIGVSFGNNGKCVKVTHNVTRLSETELAEYQAA
jgi:hypothetical protein